jgi:hypothetical protein
VMRAEFVHPDRAASNESKAWQSAGDGGRSRSGSAACEVAERQRPALADEENRPPSAPSRHGRTRANAQHDHVRPRPSLGPAMVQRSIRRHGRLAPALAAPEAGRSTPRRAPGAGARAGGRQPSPQPRHDACRPPRRARTPQQRRAS